MKLLSYRIVFLLLILGPLQQTANGASANQESHPHIVFILVDDMGYGDAQCYNMDSKIPTPNINRIAAEGMLFTDAHASGPLCHVSRYGLMTGRYPFRGEPGQWRKKATIEDNRPTIASLLKTAGYSTAMVGKWHLGFDQDGYDKPMKGGPIDRGFDDYFGIQASTDIPPYFYIRGDRAVQPPSNQIEANSSEGWSPIQGAFWREGGIAPDLELKDVLPKFTKEAVTTIKSHAKKESDQPLMLYLAYPAPHTPWLPSTEFLGTTGASTYGDFTAMVDANIGRVVEALEQTEMLDDTLLVFSSDNGPVWYEEDVKRFGHDSSGGLRGMKADAWECGHRMPFLVRWPKTVAASSVSNATISFVDIYATFAELTGQKMPEDGGPDSFSFLRVLQGKQQSTAREHLVVQAGGGTYSIREGDWKLITKLGSGGFTKPSRVKPTAGGPTGQLYNLKADSGEQKNLFLRHPDIVSRLNTQLKRIQDSEGQRFID